MVAVVANASMLAGGCGCIIAAVGISHIGAGSDQLQAAPPSPLFCFRSASSLRLEHHVLFILL
jgi:hypothetical protein